MLGKRLSSLFSLYFLIFSWSSTVVELKCVEPLPQVWPAFKLTSISFTPWCSSLVEPLSQTPWSTRIPAPVGKATVFWGLRFEQWDWWYKMFVDWKCICANFVFEILNCWSYCVFFVLKLLVWFWKLDLFFLKIRLQCLASPWERLCFCWRLSLSLLSTCDLHCGLSKHLIHILGESTNIFDIVEEMYKFRKIS